MDKAIQRTGLAGVGAGAGLSKFNLALGAIALGSVAVVAGIVAITAALVGVAKSSIETGISMESAFAGVLKTTQNLGTNLFDLTETGEIVFQEFRDLAKEIPLTFEELADIGQLVGQLGVADEDIAAVTETVAALGVATDLSTKEAALALTRFANVASQTGEVTPEQFERISSALVFLGNNFKATESEILLTSRNIAGTASLFGISEAAILGIGTAVIEAGVTSEAGGSAIQNTLTTIQKAVSDGGEELDIFAETAGLSAQQFATLWRTDATEAFTLFVEGIGDQGADAVLALDDLDLAQRRSIRTLLGISKENVDLRGIIEASSGALAENTALTREAEIRYETLESKIQILKNTFRDFGLTIFLALEPLLSGVLDAFEPLISAFEQELEPGIADIAAAITDDLLPAFGNLLDSLGIDLSQEGLAKTIETILDGIAENITEFSEFVDAVAFLIDLGKAEGLLSVVSLITGIEPEKLMEIADGLTAIGVALLTFKTLTGIAGIIGGISAALGSSAFITALTLLPGAIGSLGVVGGIGAVLAAAVGPVTAVIALIAIFVGLFVGFREEFELFWELIKQLGEIFKLLGDKLTEGVQNLLADFNEWQDQVADDLETFFAETLPATLSSIGESIRQWAIDVKDKIVEFFGQTLPTAVGELITTIGTFANDLVLQLVNKITDFLNRKVPEMVNKFRNFGRDIIQGLVDGINQKAGQLVATLTGLAQRAIEAARNILDSQSPSGVFMNIGEDIMKGLSLGIDSQASAPETSLVNAFDKMINSGQRLMPAGATTTSSIDRSMNVGDINVTTKPESPNTLGLTLQKIALVQQGF